MRKPRGLTASQIGRKGGLASARSLTKQQRIEKARFAALAMWAKRRKAVA